MSLFEDIKTGLNQAIQHERPMNVVRLRSFINGISDVYSLEPKSMELFDEVFQLLEHIEPGENNNYRQAWVKVPRGYVMDCGFESVEEAFEDFNVDNMKDLEKVFHERWPDEYYWYQIESGSYKDNRALQIGRFTISIEPDREEAISDFPYDYSELLSWVVKTLNDVLRECAEGRYNARIEYELPYTKRYGVISRKTLWDHCPSYRQFRLKNLSRDEIEHFISIVGSDNQIPTYRIKDMTFNRYFEYASLAFANAEFDTEGMDAFKQFRKYGEDFGNSSFRHVDLDSTEAFDAYYDGEGQMGGHPWGLRRGSSRSRIMLIPRKDDNGYYFSFAGDPNWNIYDIVRMYIPLKESGLPVYLSNPDECIAYLREEDMVGIVPDDTMLMYKQAYFNEPINDFYHYDPLTDEAIKHLIKWYPIDTVTLKGE